MPVMGGERDFAASGLFATDCPVARFARGRGVDALAVASDELAGVKCSTGLDGVGVVCKK
ncbi:vegetative cell wall protein gp1-like [Panicum miliaceum]|uniref:Vegetative cell wall protein gp1-like n=1 Tax=Panicum miliaceum TaxID=4540 RepID=A0A3L6SXI9_PANMI|nr:vegetative cell wall protein gp1-like [Panicum miliaceum]